MPDLVDEAGVAGVAHAAAAIEAAVKRPKPRRIKGSLCYATTEKTFDKGEKAIDVTITPSGVWMHAARKSERYFLPWRVAYDKAVSIEANIDIAARRGRVTRGGT